MIRDKNRKNGLMATKNPSSKLGYQFISVFSLKAKTLNVVVQIFNVICAL